MLLVPEAPVPHFRTVRGETQATWQLGETLRCGEDFFQRSQWIACELYFFVIVIMRRLFEFHLWFDHKNNQIHWNSMVNAISDEERPSKETKDGKNG